MNRHHSSRILAVPLVAVLLAPVVLAQSSSVATRPPVARKAPHLTTIHGDTLKDDYFWLREKSNPEVISYLKAENAYTDAVMKPTEALQEALYAFGAFFLTGFVALGWGPGAVPDLNTARAALAGLIVGAIGAAAKGLLWFVTGTKA